MRFGRISRNIGREEHKADRDADTPRLREERVGALMLLLGKTIRLLPNEEGELRAVDVDQPMNPAGVERHLVKASKEHLAAARAAMAELAGRYEPIELNRSGFRLYEKFRPEIPPGNQGWGQGRCWRRRILAAV